MFIKIVKETDWTFFLTLWIVDCGPIHFRVTYILLDNSTVVETRINLSYIYISSQFL